MMNRKGNESFIIDKSYSAELERRLQQAKDKPITRALLLGNPKNTSLNKAIKAEASSRPKN